jgi:hypothetical protein
MSGSSADAWQGQIDVTVGLLHSATRAPMPS